jgi:enamine deaminase RidA (YjgF/YER057c/UK114 family)
MTHQLINPEALGAPKGYSNGVLCEPGGRLLFVAGQVGWDDKEQIVSERFSEQFGRAIQNVATVLEAAGGKPEHVTRLTIFVSDKDEYVAQSREVGAQYRRVMGKHFPAMSLIQIAALLEEGAKVEIEATAVIPA